MEFVELIKKYAANGTYFVRKISAQGMLPLLPFPEFIPQVVDCFKRLKTETLRQNEAHGLILRANIFLEAYFKYRSVAVVPEKHSQFAADEAMIADCLFDFQAYLPKWTKYSKMTWALFVRTFRHTLRMLRPEVYQSRLQELSDAYQATLKFLFNENELMPLSEEDQVYLKECLKIKLDFSVYQSGFK